MVYCRKEKDSTLFKSMLITIGLFLFVITAILSNSMVHAITACTNGQTSIKSTVNIPETGQYQMWARLRPPDTTNQLIELRSGSDCYAIGGPGLRTGEWSWVNYENGDNTKKINLNLNQGSNDIFITAIDDGVEIDKIIFLGKGELCNDSTPIPKDDGNNCNEAPQIIAPSNNSGAAPNITPQIFNDVGVENIKSTTYKIDGVVVQYSPGALPLSTKNINSGSYELETSVELNDGSIVKNTSTIILPEEKAESLTAVVKRLGSNKYVILAMILLSLLMIVGSVFMFRRKSIPLVRFGPANETVALLTTKHKTYPSRIAHTLHKFHLPHKHGIGGMHLPVYIIGLLLATVSGLSLSLRVEAQGRRYAVIQPEDSSLVNETTKRNEGSTVYVTFRRKTVAPPTTQPSNPGNVPECPSSGIGGAPGCKTICPAGHVGTRPNCKEQSYSKTLNGINFSYTNNSTLKGTNANPIIYDGVHFTGEVLLTGAENVIFRNCKFSKGVRLFGASKNITIENCIAKGNHDYATDRWLYVTPVLNYWGGVGKDNNRIATGIVVKRVLVEDYSNDAIEINGAQGMLIEDFVFRNLWAGGQGVGDVSKCPIATDTIFNQNNPTSSCGPDKQTFDPHVDGLKVHNGTVTIRKGLFENISFQAIIATRIPERGWKPVEVVAEDIAMRNIGFQYTAPLCKAWTGTLKYKVCGSSGGGTGFRVYDTAPTATEPRLNNIGPKISINRITQSSLSRGLWITSPTTSWSLQNSTVTWISLTQKTSEGNGSPPSIFSKNTRLSTRTDGYWQ